MCSKIFITTGVLFCVMCSSAFGDDLSMQIKQTRLVCSGISDSMNKLKKMAGINTAVSGVGTVSGGVALGTGIVKTKVDKDSATLRAQIAEKIAADKDPEFHVITDKEEFYKQLEEFMKNTPGKISDKDTKELEELEQKSNTLGNIRTGTLAISAVADTAGAVMSAGNKVDYDLQTRINSCIGEVKKLGALKQQSLIEKSADSETIARAEIIVADCGEWEFVDLSKINKRSTGAAISGGTGAALSIVGAMTSATANSASVRQNENAGTEKNLNTASNVLAGGAAGASAIATVFNATQISAIKKAVSVADKCEGALRE